MDYRSLLIKYMYHIAFLEDTDFTGFSLTKAKYFTDEEKGELRKLSEEADEV